MIYGFYNPKKSALQCSFWLDKNLGILEAANVLPNANFSGPVEKGKAIFDWQNKVLITLTPQEACSFSRALHKGQPFDMIHASNSKKGQKTTTLKAEFNKGWLNILIMEKYENGTINKVSVGLNSSVKLNEVALFVNWLKWVQDIPVYNELFKFHLGNNQHSARNQITNQQNQGGVYNG